MRPRHALPVACLVVLAGCVGGLAGTDDGATTPTPETRAETTPITPPGPPDTLTRASARRTARAHEYDRVYDALADASGLTYYEVGVGYTVSEEVTVLNRSDRGVYVRVTMPYSYGTEDAVADVASEAVYVVSTDRVTLVEGSRVDPTPSADARAPRYPG